MLSKGSSSWMATLSSATNITLSSVPISSAKAKLVVEL